MHIQKCDDINPFEVCLDYDIESPLKIQCEKKTYMIAIKCLQEAMLANGEHCIDGQKRPNMQKEDK